MFITLAIVKGDIWFSKQWLGVSASFFHRYMKVSKSVSMHFFLVEIFTLIIFRLWSISLIMTNEGEIAKSLKMHFSEQKCIISQFEDDQSVRRRLH